ncbi:MAG: DUF1667 domain-containing protein [Erysipelotrichaceae bacterium]|jgi:CxxC motif-containing protein|nr:DUF1667 domain-containing protein [Erysipelotrichaceae bacterium]
MKKLICIICPRGCHLEVDENLNVTGNFCSRGAIYGKQEVSNPTRMITSTIPITGFMVKMLPVRTKEPVKKALIMKVMKEIKKIVLDRPVQAGEVIATNVGNLGVDIVASATIDKETKQY